MSEAAYAAMVKRVTENQGVKIIQYSLIGEFIKEFSTIKAAHLETKMSVHAIREILDGITKKPKSFIFKYK